MGGLFGEQKLTLNRECLCLRGPIYIEKTIQVDIFGSLFLLRPWYMAALHLGLDTHLGCRRNLSAYIARH